ncbi:MAG TPA: Xaa-Pro peptidase family protein [Nitrososphaerales archaeon]|nr:Xaa-Pro peptidase family protein [Nitrososphaerales archaeon]
MVRKGKDSPKERREFFAAGLKEKNLDLAIISNPKHIFYFSGFSSNLNMALTLMKGPRVTSFLSIDNGGKASLLLGESEVSNPWIEQPLTKNPVEPFDGEYTTYVDYDLNERMITYADIISREFQKWARKQHSGLRRVSIEEWHLPEIFRAALLSGGGGPELVGISKGLISMRRSKGADEINDLTEATKRLDYAYKIAQKNSRLGKTELDVYRRMNYKTFEKFGPFAWVNGDHASGERSLEMGGWATDREFKKGDTIILDLQTAYNNYWSDLCRTFVTGKKPSGKQEKVAETLSSAIDRAQDVMKPGTKGKEIYAAVNDEITKGGYPKLFHHAGHSIGLDDHEPPWFIPNSEDALEEGSVVVVEPGIYIKEAGGIRLEDAFVITKKGAERISKYSRALG